MKQVRVASPLLPLRLPLTISLALVLIGGFFLLNRADAQARDTIRKHHLEDIEQSLYFARNVHGTFPPYDEPAWCGSLHDNNSSNVRQQIEAALREQNEKYANPAKPFPTDPQSLEYFYWKRSPAVFELYARLETDPNAERSIIKCAGQDQAFDYGITSIWRENK